MTIPTWAGRRVQDARAHMATKLPSPCARHDSARCLGTITTTEQMVVGHKLSRATHPELTWEPSNWQIECRPCSDASSQSTVQDNAARRALIAAGIDPDTIFPNDNGAKQTPTLPVSLSGVRSASTDGQDGQNGGQDGRSGSMGTHGYPSGVGAVRSAPAASDEVSVPEWLSWNPAELARYPWLLPLLEVPESASPPLAMTPPHPDAVGTYGWEAVEFIEAAEGKALRWWQKLAVVRQLEHREDGSLTWEEIVESGSRRIGKSVRLRGVALWRLTFGPELFGERQEIVHTGSDLAVCRKAQMEAWRWARGNGFKVTAGNGKEAIASLSGDAWLVRAQDAVYGLDTTLGMVDEGWKVKPATVSEGLEPSLMERSSSQLHLTSTAHRMATSMMRSNIASALASLPGTTTLLLLWAAPAGADPGDPATWRAASAYWSPARAKLIAKKYAKALAGEVDPEADDLDPMAGFMAQYLNRWSLRTSRIVPGNPVIGEEDWGALASVAPVEQAHAVAVEGWPGEGVSVARAWRSDAGALVEVVAVDDVASAAELAKEWAPRGAVVVGADMADDPAWKARQVRVESRSGSVRESVSDMARLLSDGVMRHDGGELLSGQVLGVRVSQSADGLRVRSTGRADAVKAAVWALMLARKRKPVGKPRILMVP